MSDWVPGEVKMTNWMGDALSDIRHDIYQAKRSYDRSQEVIDKAHNEIDRLREAVEARSDNLRFANEVDQSMRGYLASAIMRAINSLETGDLFPHQQAQTAIRHKAIEILWEALIVEGGVQE
jgi:hypothetical protein